MIFREKNRPCWPRHQVRDVAVVRSVALQMVCVDNCWSSEMCPLKGVEIYILFVFANLYHLLKAFQDFLTFCGFRKYFLLFAGWLCSNQLHFDGILCFVISLTVIHLYNLLIILATVVVTVRVFISKRYYIRTLSSALLNVYHDFVKLWPWLHVIENILFIYSP